MSVVEFVDGMEDGAQIEDDIDEERWERYEFDVEEELESFVDEALVQHNVYPETNSDDEGAYVGEVTMQMNRGYGNLFVGQIFCNVVAFKQSVLDYALKHRRNIRQTRYDKTKVSFACNASGCDWRIYCSSHRGSDKWVVRSYNSRHSCFTQGHCEIVKVPVIANMFLDRIREEPEYFMPQKMQELIYERWGINVSRPQCQAARNKVLMWIERDYNEQFERLRDYRAEIIHSNPNSSVEIEANTNEAGLEVFSRFYVCFDVLRKSWTETCRPLIGVDGCFLRGKMKGQLLVALGRDGNNGIYPIAWAVVQVENTVNWLWFVKKIKVDLSLADGDGFIIVSDRQKGLIRAVELELPRIEHRMCVRHIYANLKTRHGKKSQMKPFIWNLAWSYNEAEYRENLGHLMAYDIGVYEDVLKTNPMSWCRAFYKWGNCCKDVENNSTESFNSTIVKARTKPMVPMLDIIARKAMLRIVKRKTIAGTHSGLCTPYAEDYLAKTHDEATHCKVYSSTNGMFQVVSGDASYRVNIEGKTCSCMRWDITGIPCEHVYAVIVRRKDNVEDYIADWFKTEKWRQTYASGITPMRGPQFWPVTSESKLQMPPEPAQPGRKKRSKNEKRKKGVNESPTKKDHNVKKRIMHCKICKAANHNSRFHNAPPTKNVLTQGVESQSSRVEPSQGVLTQD